MNTSNPFGTESIARQRQAEIEKQLRQSSLLGVGHPRKHFSAIKPKLVAAIVSLSMIGLAVVFLLIQMQ